MKNKIIALSQNKKGAALMWAMLFAVVIFAVLSVLVSLIVLSNAKVKTAQSTFNIQNDIDQVGEYFIRSISLGGDFPTGDEENFNDDKFAWMDSAAKEFFTHIKDTYGFKYDVTTQTITGSFRQLYETQGYQRALSVTQGDGDDSPCILHVVINEKVIYTEQTSLLFGLIKKGKNPVSQYTVEEWSSEVNHVFNGTTLEEDTFITKTWKKIWSIVGNVVVQLSGGNTEFNVVYYTNGGTLDGAVESVKRTSGESFELPNVTKAGYNFDGWVEYYVSGSSSTEGSTYAAGDAYTAQREVKFVARWAACVVSFDSNGGSNNPASVEGVVSSLPNPGINKHKDFAGWNVVDASGNYLWEANLPEGSEYVPTENITLVAVWVDKPSCIVTFHNTDGSELGTLVKWQDDEYIELTLGDLNPTKTNTSDTSKSYKVEFRSADGKTVLTTKYAQITTVYKYKLSWATEKGGASVYEVGAHYSTNAALNLYPCFTSSVNSTKVDNVSYSPTAPTGMALQGWSTSKNSSTSTYEGSEITGIVGDTVVYAVWKKQMCTVKFECTNCSATGISVPYGTAVSFDSGKMEFTFTAPSGYKIDGSPGTTGSKSVTVSKNDGCVYESCSVSPSTTITGTTTIKVVCIQYRTLTIALSNGATVTIDGTKYTSDSSITLKPETTHSYTPYDSDGISSVYIKRKTDNVQTYLSETNYTASSFTMPDDDATLYVEGKTSCVTGDTLVTMADGSTKPISEIRMFDYVLSYSFYEGRVVANPIVSIEKTENVDYDRINVEFESGSSIGVVSEHSFFDMDSREYFKINLENSEEVVGRHVMTIDENGVPTVDTIGSVSVVNEHGNYYSIITSSDYNVITNGIVSVNPIITDILFFDVNEDYIFDEEQMQKDIDYYGISDYSEWKDCMSEEVYELTKVKYTYVLVGKGLATREELVSWLFNSFNGSIENIIY